MKYKDRPIGWSVGSIGAHVRLPTDVNEFRLMEPKYFQLKNSYRGIAEVIPGFRGLHLGLLNGCSWRSWGAAGNTKRNCSWKSQGEALVTVYTDQWWVGRDLSGSRGVRNRISQYAPLQVASQLFWQDMVVAGDKTNLQ